jgi:hypothetical protein
LYRISEAFLAALIELSVLAALLVAAMLIRRTPAGTVVDGAMKASAEDRQATAARYGTNDRIFPGLYAGSLLISARWRHDSIPMILLQQNKNSIPANCFLLKSFLSSATQPSRFLDL